MSKQTVVQQLFDWIEANMDEKNFDILAAKEKALAMEKEQKIKFANEYAESGSFYCNGEFAIEKDAEDYYNETYKGGNNE